MNLSEPFIRRPVATTVLALAIVILGIFGYLQLPSALLPNVSFPTVLVTASLPGASPQTMSSAVATPLERQFSSIPGLTAMSSTSQNGSTRIILQFSLNESAAEATQDVSDAVSQAEHFLPPGMPEPPLVKNINPTATPIMFIGLSAANMPLYDLDKYAETKVATSLSTVPGVADVEVFGAQTYAVRIYANPFALAARGLSLNTVESAIKSANVDLPEGTLEGGKVNFAAQVHGQLHTAHAFNQLILAYAGGQPIPLSAVAKAQNSTQYNLQKTWINGSPGIVLAVVRQPGSNTVAISQGIRKMLPSLTASAPGGAHLSVVFDNADYIRAAIEDVVFTLLLASLLVAGVMWLFLRRATATLIGALAIPLSLMATFLVMMLLGYSLNTLTLLALTLSVGFVVDDAVVMLENINRHLERGTSAMQAALDGSREISFTVMAMTLSLAIIFLPLILMGGFIGHLFAAFGVTIAVVILLSGLIALTVTPMLASRFLHRGAAEDQDQHSRFERGFSRSRDFYIRSLRKALQHRNWLLGIAGLMLLGSVGLALIVPKSFIPNENNGSFFASIQYPTGMSFAELAAEQKKIEAVVLRNSSVQSVISSAGQGAGAFGGSNSGRLIVRLKSGDSGKTDAVIASLRKATRQFSNTEIFFQQPAAIQVGPISSNAQYQYVLQGQDWNTLDTATHNLVTALRKNTLIQSANSDLQTNNPQVSITINRPRAIAMGVTAQSIEQTLALAYGGQEVGTIYGNSNQYEVIFELSPKYQQNINALSSLSVPGSGGTLVPLSAVANFTYDAGPLSLEQYNGLPSTTISFNLAPGASLGTVTKEVDATAQQILPAGVTGEFGGNASTFESAFSSLPLLLVATILLIYVVLAILYEHFLHPFTILSALPLAGFGALLSLLVFHQPLDLYSFVGIIMLMGLVKKNGIILVDFAVSRRREGESALEAIVDACAVRYRPIMMTTFAAILGVLPIAIGLGAGSGSRVPLGVAVVGGLVFSQFLTLYITPAFYLWMESFGDRVKRWFGMQVPEKVPALSHPQESSTPKL